MKNSDKALQIAGSKLEQLGMKEYLVEMTVAQKQKALDILTIEEYKGVHPKDHSIKVEMVAVFYKNEFLGAKFEGNGKEMNLTEEQYLNAKKQF
ncbi:MAG: hypothetical protein K9J21_07140 [Bacteroidales bacterium]|nr:hypothetical protein [Bacteroidales bacterium]